MGIRRPAAVLSLCALLACPLALAACGGGSSDSTDTTGAPPFTVPSGAVTTPSTSGGQTSSTGTQTSGSTSTTGDTTTSGSTATGTQTTSSGGTGETTTAGGGGGGGTATAQGTGTATTGGANLGSAFCQQNPGAC
jgi:hypothetical protein